MQRAIILLLILTIDAPSRAVAWPLRATVTDPRGRAVSFRAVSLGGELIVTGGERPHPNGGLNGTVAVIRPLARGDTLRATTPAGFPLDLARGPVMFFTSGRDSIRVVVGRNPFGAIDPVSRVGRRLTVHLANGSVVIDAQ
jgi:hypothetical protein